MNQPPETVPTNKPESGSTRQNCKVNEKEKAPTPENPQEPEQSSDDDNNNPRSTCCCTWHGWCSFPQFPRRIWRRVFVTTLLALILADAATDVRGFVNGSVYVVNTSTDTEANSTSSSSVWVVDRRRIGINQYEDDKGKCIPWRKGDEKDNVYDSDDVVWAAVRFFVGIASVVGLLGLLLLLLAPCASFPQRLWKSLPYIFQVVWFFYSLSFLVFATDTCRSTWSEPLLEEQYDDCTLDLGGGLMLSGTVVWMMASAGVQYLAEELNKPSRRSHHENNDNEPQPVDEVEPHEEGGKEETPARTAPTLENENNNNIATQNDTNWAKTWFFLWAVLVIASVAINVGVIVTRQKDD